MDDEVSLGAFGESEPRIALRFTPSVGAAKKAIFVAELSRGDPLSLAMPALTQSLGVPVHAVALMHDGLTLDLDKNLADNEVTIPGVRARREGEKVQLSFNTKFSVMQELEEEARKRKEAEELEIKRQQQLELEQQRKAQKLREDEERERELKKRIANAQRNWDAEISQQVGVNREEFDRLLADPDPDVKKPRHYLERLNEAQELQLLDLLRACGGSHTGKVMAYRLSHQELWDRYERAKQGLQADAKNIPKKSSDTTAKCRQKPLDFMANLEPSINEFCLWHGTGQLAGAGGICANGFDIAYVGSAVGTAWGHGFYFADSAATSLGYCAGGVRVTDQFQRVKILFLCRVLCGRVRELTSAPTQEQKEELTARCLGPGGVFGPKSEVHSIHGGRFCYVCAHNHQVYPEVVMFLAPN